MDANDANRLIATLTHIATELQGINHNLEVIANKLVKEEKPGDTRQGKALSGR